MSTLQQLEERLRAIRSQDGLEERRIFARLRDSDDGIVLEASDGRALRRFSSALRDTTSATVRAVQLPNESLQGRIAWVTASVADVRRHPAHGAEQVTQALQGEVLEPFLHEDGWVLTRLDDGYMGWVRDWHLELCEPQRRGEHAERADARIAFPWVRLHEAASETSASCGETLLGTRVVCLRQEREWADIELPGGRRGWVPHRALRPGVEDWPTTRDSILEMIASFHGAPYVWGGRSPKGFDCSGLVQFVYGLHGVRLPRDSDQQFDAGTMIETPAAADLLFFGSDSISHVAVAVDAHAYLHARGDVRRNSLDPASPDHDAELAGLYRGTRRVLPDKV